MKITYIGHATLLIEMGDVRILTDPNFETSLGGFLPRVSAPGIALEKLPKLDVVLLTHAHADHLSFDALAAGDRSLVARPRSQTGASVRRERHASPRLVAHPRRGC
ncbi:MAG: MBL fold metallo-hydrolase [Verrucomicrobia bacterium]|nr:MAG: MBL fold metallo-hydrolase [Verrucomicrobiota bacterium]